jgi:SRSO17 transposase
MVPVVAPLGRSERRVAAANYVSGLLMPGQRKSIEPMAARLGVDPQRLQQFVTDSPWDEGLRCNFVVERDVGIDDERFNSLQRTDRE